MEIVMAVVIAVMFALGTYMILRRNIVKVIIGLSLLSHAVNLLLFSMSELKRGAAPLLQPGGILPEAGVADPVPQSLILTAIVIGFGVMAFLLVIGYRTIQDRPDDLDKLRITES